MARLQRDPGRRLMILVVAAVVALPVAALNDRDVKKLQDQCEAARQEALAPIRAAKTRTCIEQQLRSKGHCERYYTTYGNVTPGPTGTPQVGYFYDLPECQAWLEAREKLRVSRSRP